jgi:hypothetical protein
MADILFKQSSFKGFAASYNYLFGQKTVNSYNRFKLDYRRLIEAFHCFHLNVYYKDTSKGNLTSKFYKTFFCEYLYKNQSY